MAADNVVNKALELTFIHSAIKEVLQHLGHRVVVDDPKMLRSKMDELVVGNFRGRFKEFCLTKQKTSYYIILDMVFQMMVETDQLYFALTAYKAIEQTALKNERINETTVIVEKEMEKKSKDGSVKTITVQGAEKIKNPQIWTSENYGDFNQAVHEAIDDCRPEDGDPKIWAKNVLRRFDENGWINGAALARFARLIKDPDERQKMLDKLEKFFGPLKAFSEDLGNGITELRVKAEKLRDERRVINEGKRLASDQRAAEIRIALDKRHWWKKLF